MPLKELYVRVNLKTQSKKFFRCGTEFTREWVKLVNVDDAKVKRLREEQMLEVSTDVPADYIEPGAVKTAVVPTVPTDPAERAAAIKEAIAKLDKENTALWTSGGAPTVPAIVAITGWLVTAVERDAVWAEVGKAV